jgi:glycosyltransferase involved in cell wall biosynthesis
MKIVVITVCFNASRTIAKTLHSVSNQTYRNVEHIIIDGGSTDNTIEVVKSVGPHVFKIISEKDNGIYSAMNKGIQLAAGDVIAFLNADDYYKDLDVLAQVAFIMDNEDIDVLYGDVQYFRASRPMDTVRYYNSSRFSAKRLGWGWMPAHPGMFVRKALFDSYGLFRTDYRIAGDFEFVARVFKHPELRYRYLPKSLVCMQMGGLSTSGWRATLQLNREMIRACKANSIHTNWFKILIRYPLKALEFFQISN